MDGITGFTTIDNRVVGKGFAAVNGHPDTSANVVNDIRVLRVSGNFSVIERAVGNIVFLVHLAPAVTTVI